LLNIGEIGNDKVNGLGQGVEHIAVEEMDSIYHPMFLAVNQGDLQGGG
jgi:phage-related protein